MDQVYTKILMFPVTAMFGMTKVEFKKLVFEINSRSL